MYLRHAKIQDARLKATKRVDKQKANYQNKKPELQAFYKEVSSNLQRFKNIFHEKYRQKKDAERSAASFVGAPAPHLPMVPRDMRRLEKQKAKEALAFEKEEAKRMRNIQKKKAREL